MKFASCFLLVLAIELRHVRKIASEPFVVKLDTSDYRLDVVEGEAYWDYLMDESSTSHVSSVQIGSAEQFIRVQFSTAANTSWVISEFYDECDSNMDKMRKIRKFYKPRTSQNYFTQGEEGARVLSNYPEELKQWLFGYMGGDSLYFERPDFHYYSWNVTENFLEVRRASSRFTTGKADAVISLRYDPSNRENNLVSKFCKRSAWGSKVSFWFPRKTLGDRRDTRGELVLCIIDDKVEDDSIHFTEDIGGGEWRIQMHHIGLKTGKKYTVLTRNTPTEVTFDSATDRIYGPGEEVAQLYKLANVQSHAKYRNINTIECSKRDQLPNITFHIQGELYTMNGVDYTEQLMPRNPGDDTICEILIKPASINHWILGQSFFRVVYTVFDANRGVVGFGRWQ